MSGRTDDNYCEHGRYIGGCGADYLCGYCEDGTTRAEYLAIVNEQARQVRLRHFYKRAAEKHARIWGKTLALTYKHSDRLYACIKAAHSSW